MQSSLPSSHILFDEVDNHRADLVNLQTLCNPYVWNTVKSFCYSLSRLSIDSFSWSYIPAISSYLLIADLYMPSFLSYTLFVLLVKAGVQLRMYKFFLQ